MHISLQHIIKFQVITILMIYSIKLSSQPITGIYTIQENYDTTFIHQYLQPFKTVNLPWGASPHYGYQYHSLLDTEYGATHAVVLPAEYENNYRIIFLNKNQPKETMFYYSYGDGLKRKYLGMDFTLLPDRGYWSFRCNVPGFLCHSNFNNEQEADTPLGWDGRYAGSRYVWKENTLLFAGAYYKWIETEHKDADGKKFFIQNRPITAMQLKTKKPYVEVVVFPRDTKFYFSEKDESREKILNEGDFIAVTHESPEWLHGDHIDVNGNITSGKIFIDDLTEGETSTRIVNGVTLNIKYIPPDTMSYSELGQIIRIKTYYENQLLQVIKESEMIRDDTELICTPDINFDGYPDLMIPGDYIGTVNYSNLYYVFDPETKLFHYNETLSGLSQPDIDATSKTITSAWRGGGGMYGTAVYVWRNGEVKIQEQTDILYIDDNEVEITETHYKNGQKVSEKTYQLSSEEYWGKEE